MSYGFNLSGVTVPNGVSLSLTLQKGTDTPLTYNLEYSEGEWFYPSDGSVIEAYNYDGGFYIVNYNFTSEDESDEYTINLSLPEEPTQSFSDAVQQVLQNTNVINPLDTLYDNDVTIVDSPVEIVFTDSLVPYPVNTWNVTVNDKKLSIGEFGYMFTDPETHVTYMLIVENGYSFLALDENHAPVPGTYSIVITARKKTIDGHIQISNLECNKSFAEIEYLKTNGLISSVTNPEGASAIACATTSSSFSATFLIATGAGSATAVIYTLDDSDTVTTTHYSTNITLTSL